ncbi:MAG: ABC transporter ATP-binding protein [Bacillota bacterium]|nr:ABC transporter ATP-binding protein [Bacillota bacterium]
MQYAIEMRNITKAFPGILANDNVTLELRKGEIHALLGENGAGKSTLMSILFGLYQPDSGEIKINGQKVTIKDPNVANELGIGMVHQHFKLVDVFTVTENIILGMEPTKGIYLDTKVASKKIKELSDRYNLSVDPDALIKDISVGMQQRVEILKMLYRDAEILIFDEPTAVLTPQEIHELMNILKKLKSEGKSIVLITHKLKEIKEAADRCTVLRKGRYIATVDVAQTSESEMAKLMVGRDVTFKVQKGEAKPGAVVLRIDGLHVKDNRHLPIVKNLNIEVKSGEIYGLAGIDGNGQKEFIEAITGLRPIVSGNIWLNNIDITHEPVRKKTTAGIGHIPEDRHKHGLVLDYKLSENLVLQTYYQKPYSSNGLLNQEAIRSFSERMIEEFDIRAGQGAETPARSMSGGNQQKAIIAREVNRSPALLIAAQPTRGLDVGAIEYIHKRLIEERDKGKAVLLISYELDEILSVSDRVGVIYEGEIVATMKTAETNENDLGYLMGKGRLE